MARVDKYPLKSPVTATELRQVGALPLRIQRGKTEVCLVTTRETRRWTIPKGWPMRNHKDCRAAAIEAEEEAGLLGKIGKEPVGEYLYWKRRDLHFDLVRVFVYRLDVTGHLPVWREMNEREVRWFTPGDAALLVEEPGLSALLEQVASPA
ncbi:NUDIX hydrolase [Labrys sp. ZIDIC5]|uniref:NUDIX hydrolase n=1 Tax=Labrys sedimenti TaxID=3106036 RepID=UPI002ACAF559|nr:NUDIX hydrolase [Labrys sp. ZIDIC5]MDZ5451820.1 NUDIX hydrolase [Labrys sp. ZIDIC5]